MKQEDVVGVQRKKAYAKFKQVLYALMHLDWLTNVSNGIIMWN